MTSLRGSGVERCLPENIPKLVAEKLASEPQKSNQEDQWALQYLNLLHVQPILEAFDDDGTGFVSVKEVNELTSARPDGWRLASIRSEVD